VEANFDGLIGPTHNYAGLSFGNLASASNAEMTANPREAAKQGLAKMKFMADLGLVQGVLPPHQRPHLPSLRALGFSGSDSEIIARVAGEAPGLLPGVSAAAAMWTANAATVSPGVDTADGRLHFTPANLAAMFHRAIEPATTSRVLRAIFADEARFAHHAPLPGGMHFGDEGAANHNRFCAAYGEAGLALFVYGREVFGQGTAPTIFPARQAREASQALARQHGLRESRALYVQQNPAVIDAGAFHNDVVAVANQGVFFYHQLAYADPAALQAALQAAAPEIDFQFIEVAASDVPIGDAVTSYLFNSQLVSAPAGDQGNDGAMTLILPEEARETASTRAYLEGLAGGDHPIDRIEFLDLRQSMRNGGGPACLRLRVVLSTAERAALSGNVLLDDALYESLTGWVEAHYRDRLAPGDLADPALMLESNSALDELSGILGLGAIYDFQR
jgi:succinylarginine dihydrolase